MMKVSLIILKIISLAVGGEVNFIATLIWAVVTVGLGFGVQFFVGYKFKAYHAAVVTDAVSVGVIPDDMDAMAKESLE